MNEVISSIIDAESKADEIISLSIEKSKKIKAEGESQAENIKNSAIAHSKLHRASANKEAEERAENEYKEIISAGNEKAGQIISAARSKTESIATKVVEELLR